MKLELTLTYSRLTQQEEQHQLLATVEVLKMADWSSESTFKNFYYRPTVDPAFVQGVLSGGQDCESYRQGNR